MTITIAKSQTELLVFQDCKSETELNEQLNKLFQIREYEILIASNFNLYSFSPSEIIYTMIIELLD